MYEFKTALDQNTFLSLKIFEALMQKNITDDDRAKIISEGFAQLESRYPDLKEMVTKRELSETELRLIKEIESTRLEIKELDNKIVNTELKLTKQIKELDSKLSKEIKELDSKIVNVELKLTKEIKELDNKLTREIKDSKFSTIKWVAALMFGQVIALGGLFFAAFRLFGVSN
jgi:chromosome segregation ATPase